MLVDDAVVAEEIQLLETCISDLIRLVALPALWGATGPEIIAENLCSVLTGMLRLEFVHVDLEAHVRRRAHRIVSDSFRRIAAGGLVTH